MNRHKFGMWKSECGIGIMESRTTTSTMGESSRPYPQARRLTPHRRSACALDGGDYVVAGILPAVEPWRPARREKSALWLGCGWFPYRWKSFGSARRAERHPSPSGETPNTTSTCPSGRVFMVCFHTGGLADSHCGDKVKQGGDLKPSQGKSRWP
jgi:hypothetical protein